MPNSCSNVNRFFQNDKRGVLKTIDFIKKTLSQLEKNITNFWPFLAMLIMAALLIYFKFDYLFQRFIFLMGLLFVPYVSIKRSGEKSIRFGVLSLIMGSLLDFENGNMLFYFCACFGLLFLWEYKNGKLNNLPFFLFIIISPVFQYIANVWSFPIRLELSKLAGKVLSLMGRKIEVAGNVILLDGQEFAVDAACMGLNMLSVSLLLSLVLLAHQERLHKMTFSFWEINGWMFLALVLSVFSNFNRLLSLVLFNVLPDNPMHDVWGLLALFAFVLIPVFLLLKWRAKLSRVSTQSANTTEKLPTKPIEDKSLLNKNKWIEKFYIPSIVSIAIIFILIFNGNSKDANLSNNLNYVSHISLPGFNKTTTPDGMLKLSNDSLLIYVKPPAGFLRASHDPRICWRGSGFEFKQIKKEKLDGLEFYTAIMEKGDDRLFTAWWYDNGQNKTVEEWTWRWNEVLGGGKGYYLINFTCSTKEELERAIKRYEKLLLL